jgi:hypothetical protein
MAITALGSDGGSSITAQSNNKGELVILDGTVIDPNGAGNISGHTTFFPFISTFFFRNVDT